jgi:hypothetical protein
MTKVTMIPPRRAVGNARARIWGMKINKFPISNEPIDSIGVRTWVIMYPPEYSTYVVRIPRLSFEVNRLILSRLIFVV